MTYSYEAWLSSRESRRARSDRAFWTRIDLVDDCWIWTGSHQSPSPRSSGGYGFLTRFGRQVFAHRHAYALVNGPIPAGALVLHSCDNPPCVNPAHLSLGDQSQNISQMWERGRRS